ncbi:MAG: ATP-binding cassette domain-containing protein, partial [Oscillospiraceae bacterium]|nr:ATP-binding cassette domain-containing protein [Oscillospiraceae bacterium]
MELYQIKNLTFTYPLAAAPALNDISLTVQQGEFVTICGASGCGKTTFLRHLKPVLTPHGTKKGELLFSGISLAQMDPGTQAAEIGFVLQTPDSQIVTDKVWHELAFGLESLGYDNPTIRLRVAEMASFFGIQHWFSKDVNALSGGEKQLLNLASVMAMQPSVLILDEPTSQLDPIAAADFLETVQKINRALGTTIILTEHRLEEVLPMSDRVLVLEKGKIIADDTPQAVGEALKKQNHPMFFAMPVPMRVYAGVKSSLPCPVTVRDGRKWLDSLPLHKSAACRKPSSSSVSHTASVRHAKKSADPPAVRLKDVWFKYDKNLPDTIKGLSLEVNQGQLYCILGGNGTGKTTALS